MQKKLSSLSVFFPVYNEEKNLPLLLEEAVAVIPKLARQYEIIVVNDGSTDHSRQVAKEWSQRYPQIKLVNHQQNQGYGAALRTGFKQAQFDWIFFTDADLQFNLKELAKFIPWSDKYRVIIGYRKVRAEGWRRSFNAHLFKIFIDLLYRLGVRDIDCAFKLLDRELIQSLHLISSGAFTTSEMLYRLKKKGIKFKELPVHHQPRLHGQPTGNSIKVILKAAWEALSLYFQVKLNLLRSL